MTELRPIVYTRPFAGDDDFRFFARPASLVGDFHFVERMRNVLATENYRGGIKGRRWHVLRTKNSIVVGFATQEFERYDAYPRRLRGYYGFAMPVSDICLPDVDLFCALDKEIVEPRFHEKNLKERDFGIMHGLLFDNPAMYRKIETDIVDQKFNFDPGVVNYIPVDVDVDELLKEAIYSATKSGNFECVIGLNSRKHAEGSHVLNCVCYEQPTALRVNIGMEGSDPRQEITDELAVDKSVKDREFNHQSTERTERPGFFERTFMRIGQIGQRRKRDAEDQPCEPTSKELTDEGSNVRRASFEQALMPMEERGASSSSQGSVVASHRRGWNIRKTPSASATTPAVDGGVKNELGANGPVALSGIVDQLASLHSEWQLSSAGNERQIALCDKLAEIIRLLQAHLDK